MSQPHSDEHKPTVPSSPKDEQEEIRLSPPPMRRRSTAISGSALGRPRSSAVSTPIAPPKDEQEDKELSPPPMRRRSSAIIGSALGRPRSSAVSTPIAPPKDEQEVIGLSPPPPPMRSRSSAISGSALARSRPRPSAVSTPIASLKDEEEREMTPPSGMRQLSSAISGSVFSRGRSGAVPSDLQTPLSGAQRGPLFDSSSPMPRIHSGQQSMGRETQLQSLGEEDSDSLSIPPVNPEHSYVEYTRNKRMTAQTPLSAFESYTPADRGPRGPHQQYGQLGAEGYEYPYPPTELGQSQTGYTERHPSQENLGRVQDEIKRRAVYGTHEGKPIQGAADWSEYFQNWTDLGQLYQKPIPFDEPLTQDEKDFAQKYGFSFEKQLGRGSYGTVWVVLATRLIQRPVPPGDPPMYPPMYIPVRLACKILSLKRFKSGNDTVEASVKKLQREAELHQTLNHRNIIKCEHIFYVHDPQTGFPFCRMFMLMELCDGDLKGMLENHPNKKFNEREAMDMFNDVCNALQYMHDQHICHFDIKIHNIMYVKEGGNHICYKLGDFGVSKKYVSESVAKIFGTQGTRLYMAPELQRQPKGLSQSKPADIYSLGCVLAETLTGRAKFRQLFNDFNNKGLTQEVFDKWEIGPVCAQLINRMRDENPDNRPTIAQS